MNKMHKELLGCLLIIVSVWGGSFVLNELPLRLWMVIPTSLTIYAMFIYGLKLALFSRKK